MTSETETNANIKASIDIRPALPSDWPVLADLCVQLGYSTPANDIKKRLEEICNQQDSCISVATDSSGAVIGFIQVSIVWLLAEGFRMEINSLVVDSRIRNQGIGKILVAWGEQWARDKGLSQVVVRSRIDREPAHRFYRNFRYSDFKTQHAFIKRLD